MNVRARRALRFSLRFFLLYFLLFFYMPTYRRSPHVVTNLIHFTKTYKVARIVYYYPSSDYFNMAPQQKVHYHFSAAAHSLAAISSPA